MKSLISRDRHFNLKLILLTFWSPFILPFRSSASVSLHLSRLCWALRKTSCWRKDTVELLYVHFTLSDLLKRWSGMKRTTHSQNNIIIQNCAVEISWLILDIHSMVILPYEAIRSLWWMDPVEDTWYWEDQFWAYSAWGRWLTGSFSPCFLRSSVIGTYLICF